MLLLEHVADKIILMQALHDQDDSAMLLVIQTAIERIVVPLIGILALSFGDRLVQLAPL
jgi:hypothetical protein